MSKILSMEAKLLLQDMGMTEEQIAPMIQGQPSIDLQTFKEAYTYAWKNKASSVQKYLAKPQYLLPVGDKIT